MITTDRQLPPHDVFAQGIQLGQVAARRMAAWAEENPGQMLVVGLGLGFLVGKLLLRKPRRIISAESF